MGKQSGWNTGRQPGRTRTRSTAIENEEPATTPQPPPEPEQAPPVAPPVEPPSTAWAQPPPPPGGPEHGDALQALIPTKNPPALAAYYLAVFALIPCIGLLLGGAALGCGIYGLKKCSNPPGTPGKAHAWIGIVLGGICFLANLALLIVVVAAAMVHHGD